MTASDDATDDTMIGVEDFNWVELRIMRIVEAEHVEGADKLLRSVLALDDAGDGTVHRRARGRTSRDSWTG